MRGKEKLTRLTILGLSAAFTVGMCLAGCAPQQADSKPGNGAEQAAAVEWSPKTDCGTCHSTEQASLSDQICTASQHGGVPCIQCHADESGLASVHGTATAGDAMPAKLKKTSVEEDVCLSCHGSWEELAGKTADCTVLTDEEGTVVNPHDFPDVGDHGTITCSSCHDMHAEQGDQMKVCLSCHHEDVFACGTCHD